MGKFDNIRKRVQTPNEAYNNMFGVSTADKNSFVEIDINKLIPYPNQPFKPYTQEKLEELSEDIKINGIMSPVIVRLHPQKDGLYEILAGRNRRNAAELAEIKTIPCIVKDVDDNTATLIMVNTNLNQRQELLPSEKAWAYRIQREAESCQGKRNDLVQNVHEVEEQIDFTYNVHEVKNDSKRNILYFIRLTYLVPTLLEMVDENFLSVRAGVEISYISEENQNLLYGYLSNYHKLKISIQQAKELREIDKTKFFDEGRLRSFFYGKALKDTKVKASISISFSQIKDFVDVNREDIQEYIIMAIKAYGKSIR